MSELYRRADGHYYICAESQTTVGLWMGVRPFLKLGVDEPAARLGEAVCEALAASRTGIPHPTDWDAVEDPTLAMAGVKSWAKFAKHAKHVAIEDENGTLRIIPYKQARPRGSFEQLETTITLRNDVTPAAIGEAVVKAFEMCE